MQAFYTRLYENSKRFKTIDAFLHDLNIKHQIQKEGTQTYIIGSMPDTKSFRNFVCLDTRSREIRNKIETTTKNETNIIIRKYLSSAGEEYFISFEDQQGYLYGFTRLMLPYSSSAVSVS